MLFVLESATLIAILSFLRRVLEKQDVHYFFILVIIGGAYGLIMLLLNRKKLFDALKMVSSESKY